MNQKLRSGIFCQTLFLFVLACIGGSLHAQDDAAEDTLSTEDSEVFEETADAPLPLDKIQSFAEIFTRIKSNYVEPISDEELLDYAIRGMLHGLDPHSIYLKDESYEDLNEGTTGSFTGLGMEVVMDGGFVKVIAPIDDTPAAEAGIQPNDLIIRMDGKTVSGLSLREATDRMRGKPGTKITLTILRESEPDPFDLELTRAVVRLSSVKRERLSEEIGYIRITQFQIATAENFRKELNQLKDSEGFAGLVLDLRNNPGGLLTSAVSVADVFLTEGVIVKTKARNPANNQEYTATPTDILDGKPIVVLINGGSASASEIVAGALQDHKRALILGTDSFGKGSVQTVLNIADKEAIKLTTARYYTPSGRSIQAEGISPDVEIPVRRFSRDEESRLQRLKENDLPGRLSNAEQEEESTDESSGKKRKELSDKTKDMLAQDYQLNEAFNLLKGLVLYAKSE